MGTRGSSRAVADLSLISGAADEAFINTAPDAVSGKGPVAQQSFGDTDWHRLHHLIRHILVEEPVMVGFVGPVRLIQTGVQC